MLRRKYPENREDNITSISETLEQKARRLYKDVKSNTWDSQPQAIIQREIALTLEQIYRLNMLHKDLEHSLTDSECTIGNDLMHLTPHDPNYPCYHADPRVKLFNKRLHQRLKSRMERIKEERRRLSMSKEEKLLGLHEKLLGLLHKHSMLSLK